MNAAQKLSSESELRERTNLELWAGPECSVVRVGDRYVDELALTGHERRADDLDRLAELGVRAVRQPVLWERTRDWAFADQRLERLRALGVRPIVGLVHHGSGPLHTSLLDSSFVNGLAAFARSVAERYPWLRDFTPLNEPLTTARFSALYGHWYPHAKDDRAFVRALLVECEAIRAAMREIREIIPDARLIQTEDVATVFSTPHLAYQAEFENQRRFLSLDLLLGRISEGHPLYRWLIGCGAPRELLASFHEHPCAPDVIGVNYYVTSDRFLDEGISKYPEHVRGGNGRETYADVEAVRVCGAGICGHRALLEIMWARYRRPLALTEVHMNCTPEEQVRWLYEAWRGANSARQAGADVRAVTAWAAFGAYDWDSLLMLSRGHYEPGIFDVRHGEPRATALAAVARDLVTHSDSAHPLLAEPGWWHRVERLLYSPFGRQAPTPGGMNRPILVTGANGDLGRAFERACAQRGLDAVTLSRAQLDITDPTRVENVIDAYHPWAVINAAGYERVDDAEDERERCHLINARGPGIIAEACAVRSLRFLTFSSDLVFDGEKREPYAEDDAVAPLCVYGASKVEAERLVLERAENALVLRTSSLFGLWAATSPLVRALATLAVGQRLAIAEDRIISPTYTPDLVHGALTLLVDGASGIFHLVTPGAVSWFELVRSAAGHAGVRSDGLTSSAGGAPPRARRPRYSALTSKRAALLSPLDDALARFASALISERLRSSWDTLV